VDSSSHLRPSAQAWILNCARHVLNCALPGGPFSLLHLRASSVLVTLPHPCCPVTLSVPASHLAAAEGCYSVAAWLLEECGADANPVDRFKRTPLEVGGWSECPVLACMNACMATSSAVRMWQRQGCLRVCVTGPGNDVIVNSAWLTTSR